MYLSNLNKNKIGLNVDVMIKAGVLDILISLGEEPAEGLIGIHHSKFRGLPAQLASLGMQIPDCLRNKEVVVLDLSVEVVGRNVEESLTAVEIEMDTVALRNSGLPTKVVLVSVEGMNHIVPGILESLDFTIVLFLTHRDHQVLVFD